MPKTIHQFLLSRWLYCAFLLAGANLLSAQFNVQLSGTDPACFGLAGGSVVSNVTGATPPISYAWSNGATTSFLENVLAGEYTVTVSDNGGNVDVASITLSQPDQVTLDLTADQMCQEPFEITANGGGGVPPFTYNWSNGASTESITVNSGTYCVTIVDSRLCGTFGCIDVEPMQPTVSVPNVSLDCFGDESGTLTAFPGPEGTPPFTYNWSNGASGQTIGGLNVGSYTVTLTDVGGCTATATGFVSQPTQLNVTASNDGPSCPGIFLTTVTAFPSGGTPPYSFLWSDGSTTQAVSSLNNGTYSVTVTDANDCAAVTSTTIIVSDGPDVIIEGDRIICGTGNTGELTASASTGTPGYQFMWSTGAQTPTITNLEPGTYTVTVTDANGCTDVASATLTRVEVSVSLSRTDETCFESNDGTATVTVTGGSMPYTYLWSTGAITATITNLAAGTYSVTATEANGCKAIGSITVFQPIPLNVTPTVTNIPCAGGNTGAIDISVTGGTPNYTYSWSNGANTQDLNNIAAGTYTVTVTDANGCVRTATATVSQPTPIVANAVATNVACNGDATGTVNLTVSGGTAPYTYSWTNGATSQDLSNLPAGTYTVTVTDANQCIATAQATVTQPPVLSLSTTKTDILCAGQNTGSINLSVSGGTPGYTYLWSNGATTQDLNNLTAGTYTVTVRDANQCVAVTSVTITAPNPLVLNGSVTDVNCNGEASGAINIIVGGGTPIYSYTWSNGANSQDLSNIVAGTYTVTVTDNNGCTLVRSFTVDEPTALNTAAFPTDVDCFGAATGSVNLTVSGGTPAYTYVWSNGATSQDIFNLTAGTYTVTVTDANGCTSVEQATVNQPDDLVLSRTQVGVFCNGESTGSIDLSVAGGTPGYTYSWNTGATTQDLNNIPAGTYSVTVTDANGCMETLQTTINEAPALTATGVVTDVLCNGDETGSINITVSGGTPIYSYSWNTGMNTQDLFDIPAGDYSVTITDIRGCSITRAFTVDQPTALNTSATHIDADCSGSATGSVNLTVSGGTPGYTYLWSNGAMTQDLNNVTAGTYTVTVTDANGCTSVETETVGEATSINLSGLVTDVLCNGDATGAIDLTVSGGTPGYTYAWNTGATTQDLNNLTAGVYSVTVTDANGCSANISFTVDQPDDIDLNINAPIIQCGGGNSGSITVIPNGGSGGFTYLWSNGATTPTIDNLTAGIYSVTVTDANGCTEVAQSISLQEIPELSCSVEVVQQPTTGNNGSLTVNVDGGTAPFTYEWSNGGTTATIGNLSGGDYTVTVTDANGCVTTCAGSLDILSGIGDYVWEDLDLDGIQDVGEPGIPGVTVNLKNEAGVVIATTTTDANGFYSFMGLQPGTYSVQFVTPDGMDYTASNVNDNNSDTADSDIIPGMNGMTGQYVLDPGEFDMTVDAGFIIPPDGAISDPCICLNNATTDIDGQFGEEITITTYSGLEVIIVEQMNMFLDDPMNNPPMAPQLVPIGTLLEEHPLNDGSNMSEYIYHFRLVDAMTYSVTVRIGEYELSIMNTCEYPVISFDEEPPSELCRFDPSFPLNANVDVPGELVYVIAGQEVEVLDPSTLPVGTYDVEVRLIPTNPDDCEAILVVDFDILDDCPAKIGDFVWFDADYDGVQDPGEDGIEGVKVTINSQDGTFMDMQFTDENGMYMFMVDPGTYKITFEQPAGLIASPSNQGGDDALDSDLIPGMLMTEFVTLGPDEMNMTIDAGFYNPCIANINDPGTIGFDQEICGPGNVPDLLVELTPATGGIGDINYLWMYNTVDPTQDITFWTPVPNSDSENFQPGPLYESTYFTRCVRRNNCVFLESNVILITVGDDANAVIDGPNLVCEVTTVTYTAVGAESADDVQWSFSGPATVTDNGDNSVDVRWGSFGVFSATLSVTENGCVATRTMTVSVINNPATCGNGFTANGSINNLQQREVNVNWMLPVDGSVQLFEVERSVNGVDFVSVGTVTEPSQMVNGDVALYSFDDVSPLAGRNLYRVRLSDDRGNDVLSNVITLMLNNGSTALGRVYPNPAVGNMIHVEMYEDMDENQVSVQLYNGTGNLISTKSMQQERFSVDLPLNNQPAGVYFLRIVNGDRTETHRVVVNE